jgi:hypothetical protein
MWSPMVLQGPRTPASVRAIIQEIATKSAGRRRVSTYAPAWNATSHNPGNSDQDEGHTPNNIGRERERGALPLECFAPAAPLPDSSWDLLQAAAAPSMARQAAAAPSMARKAAAMQELTGRIWSF